ncbi:MAG: hypothetical protein Q8K92_00045, partial [Leadbetterella sp.]|nr:hypothetical protein [Leadbetterella sp.]
MGTYYLHKPGELRHDLDSSLVAIQEAKSLSETLNDKKLKEESLILMSFCYFDREEPKLGREAVNQLIESIQKSGDLALEADTLMHLAWYMFRSKKNYEERIFCYQRAISLYQKLGDKESPIIALKEIADIHLNQGKLDESEKELLQVIEQYKSIGFRNLHYTYDLLAALSALRGNYNQALFYALEMIKSMETTGDSASYSEFYIRIGRIYEQLNQIEKSIDCYKKAYPKSNLSKYSVCLSLSRGLIKLGRTKEALAMINELTQKEPSDRIYDKAYTANIFAMCYENMQQYDLAEKYYLEMIQFEQQFNRNDSYTSVVNFIVGLFYVNRHRYLTAEPYLKKVLSMPEGIVAVQRLKDVHLLLFKVYSAQGKYLSAIQHFQVHKKLNDSIFNETKS